MNDALKDRNGQATDRDTAERIPFEADVPSTAPYRYRLLETLTDGSVWCSDYRTLRHAKAALNDHWRRGEVLSYRICGPAR